MKWQIWDHWLWSSLLQVLQIEMQDDKSNVAISGKKPLNPLSVSPVRSESISAEIDFIQRLTQGVCVLFVCLVTFNQLYCSQFQTKF